MKHESPKNEPVVIAHKLDKVIREKYQDQIHALASSLNRTIFDVIASLPFDERIRVTNILNKGVLNEFVSRFFMSNISVKTPDQE